MFAEKALLPPLEVCLAVAFARTKDAVPSKMGGRRSRRGRSETQRRTEERYYPCHACLSQYPMYIQEKTEGMT